MADRKLIFAAVLCVASLLVLIERLASAEVKGVSVGDRLTIVVDDIEAIGHSSTFHTTLDGDGVMEIKPYILPIKVGGMTTKQIEEAIREYLKSAKVLEDARVTVQVHNSPPTTSTSG